MVVDSDYKEPYWLFEIKATTLATDHWSTLATTYDGDSYTFKVIPSTFKGITLNRPQSELSIQAPNDLYFEVSNDDSTLDANDYIDASVMLRLVVSDGTNIHNLRSWKFNTTFCEAVYQRLQFTCEDFVQRHLRGNYPTGKTISNIFPSEDPDVKHIEDTLCPAIPFGTAYVPIRSVYTDSERYYLLGEVLSSNLVTNGNFESGSPPDNWTAMQSATLSSYAINPHSGSACLRILENGELYPAADSTIIAVTGNTTYHLEGWYKQGTTLETHCSIRVWDVTNSSFLLNENLIATSDWQVYRDSFTTPSNCTQFLVSPVIQCYSGTGSDMLFDNITLWQEDYDIEECRSPREWGLKSVWESPAYSFNQSTTTDQNGNEWQMMQAIIADSDDDGEADANGLWLNGDFFLDMPLKFTRSDLESYTNPADIIEYVLEDMGVSSGDIDSGNWTCSFNQAAATFDSWGLELNGAFYYKETREEALAKLLNMCHSTLRVTDKVELHVLSAVSQATVDETKVLRTVDIGEGTFRYNMVTPSEDDAGLIAYQIYGDSQDELIKMSVPAKATQNSVSSNILELPFVSNATHALNLGSLYYQRQLLKKANVSFTTSSKLIMRNPDEVLSIDHANYGGTYDVLIDRMTIGKDLSIGFDAFSTTATLDDWGDLSFTSMTVYVDDSTTYWAPVMSGPNTLVSSGWIPNMLPGKVRIGNSSDITTYIELDPIEPLQKFVENDTVRLEVGDLDDGNYGIRISDYAGNTVLEVDGTSAAAITNIIIDDILEGTAISMQGWQFDATFSESDYNTVVWTSGTLTLSTGTEYNILAGTTGDMTGPVFIYIDLNTSTTELQVSSTGGNAVGANKLLIATAQPGESGGNPNFQVFGGKGGLLIGADQLAANAITANHISAGLINADMIDSGVIQGHHIAATEITGITITAGTFRTAIEDKRIIIDTNGIELRVTDTVGLWGDGSLWGDGDKWGSGALAYIHHTSEDVPFFIDAEQETVGDFRFYPRNSNPNAASPETGEVACVDNGGGYDLVIYTGASWATVGHTLT